MKYKSPYPITLFLIISLSTLFIACSSKERTDRDSSSQKPSKVHKLKLATTWTPTLIPFSSNLKSFATLVKTLSNGELLIRVDFANKHKSPLGIFDMVKTGQYDMGHSSSFFWKGKDINLLPFTTMPFGMTTPEQYGWFYYGGGLQLMMEAYAPHHIYSYPGGNTGNQMGGWFTATYQQAKRPQRA